MKNAPFKITEIWAFVTVDPKDGDEGIPAFLTPDGVMLPLVCADKARLVSMLPVAEKIAKSEGFRIKLLRFHGIEVIEGDILENPVDLKALGGSNGLFKAT